MASCTPHAAVAAIVMLASLLSFGGEGGGMSILAGSTEVMKLPKLMDKCGHRRLALAPAVRLRGGSSDSEIEAEEESVDLDFNVSESSEASTPDSDEVNIKNDYAQFFDEDGSFDVLGYAAFRKWPGRGQKIKGNSWKFTSTRMESHDAGAEYGIFVDIEAKNASLLVTGVKIASYGLSNPELAHQEIEENNWFQDPLKGLSNPFALSVYTCEGSSLGKEMDRRAWSLLATNDTVQLPRINGKEDWDAERRERWDHGLSFKGEWEVAEPAEPAYGDIPWRPVKLEAGERRGFLIHGNLLEGVANRWPRHSIPGLGDVSDEDQNLRLYVCRAMPDEVPFSDKEDSAKIEQCEECINLGYAEPIETDFEIRQKEGHAFVGEILYKVL